MDGTALHDPAGGPGSAGGRGGKRWTVGTLSYTRFALFSVFFWMLWGDLCVMFMESIIPRLVPLQLEHYGASKATIGLITASVPAGVELLINPFVSTYSDRYRSRWGRRRPFIVSCTPILAGCLLLIGFCPQIMDGIGLGERNGAIVIAFGVLLAVFQFFNVVVLATYYYMIADVVPQAVIGRFTALYRVASALGGMAFNKLVFPHSEGHEQAIYVGAAALYLVVFLLMTWRVKEGEYPPPPAAVPGRNAGAAVAEWMRESFSIRFYQKLYSIGLFYYFATGSTLFYQFFALNDLHMSRDDFGDAMFWAGFWSLPIFFVMGPLADRFHPLRAGVVGMALMGLTSLGCFLFIHDVHSFKVWLVIFTLAQTVWLGSQVSLLPKLLPRDQYGQYCSANNTLCAIGKFGAPFLSGLLIGALRDYNRFSFLWTAAFSAGGVVAVLVVYWHWKRLGGDLGYTSPRYVANVESTRGFDVTPVVPTEAAPIAGEAELASPAAPSAVDAPGVTKTQPRA